MKTLRLLLLLFLSLGLTSVSAQQTKGIFWEVSGNGLAKPSYLFGTYHVLNHGFLETVPKVKSAFEQSSGVIVETTIDSTKLLQLTPLMMMKDSKISDLMSADEFKLVSEEVASQTGMPMSLLNQFKPYMVATLLTLSYSQKQNKSELDKYPGRPIDIYLAYEGKRAGKSVSTFETMEQQMAILLDHTPVKEQATQLVELVKNREEVIASQTTLLNLYINQDLGGMNQLLKKYEKQFGETSHLLDDRNVKWMESLPEFLKKGNQFLAVGAGHFTGEKSLLKLLQQKGYTIKTLEVK